MSAAGAPAAVGPYSQAVRFGDLLFLSGQIPLDPGSGEMVPGGIAEQTERVMRNLQAVVEEAGGTMADIIKTTCYLCDLAEFPVFNEVYGRWFPGEPPARETVQVGALPKGALVEVSAVCALPGEKT